MISYDRIYEKNEAFEEECYNFDELAEEAAKAKGLVVVYPKSNQLQIDIDSEEQHQEFSFRLKDLQLYKTKYGSHHWKKNRLVVIHITI